MGPAGPPQWELIGLGWPGGEYAGGWLVGPAPNWGRGADWGPGQLGGEAMGGPQLGQLATAVCVIVTGRSSHTGHLAFIYIDSVF